MMFIQEEKGEKDDEDVLLWRTKGFPTLCQVAVWSLPGNPSQENNRYDVEITLGFIDRYSSECKNCRHKKISKLHLLLVRNAGQCFLPLLEYVSDAALGSEINYPFPAMKKKQWIKWEDQNMRHAQWPGSGANRRVVSGFWCFSLGLMKRPLTYLLFYLFCSCFDSDALVSNYPIL